MKTAWALFAAASALAASVPATAAQTGPAGGGLPFDNYQNYLSVTQLISLQGIFPSRADTLDQSSAAQQTIAMLRTFGGNYATGGGALTQGQILAISQNTALFSLLGTTYGGDGKTTFALPDLRGRSIIGVGQGPGLSNRLLGEQAGASTVTLTLDQMPAHAHGIDVPPGQTGVTGGNQPFDNMQPSLAMTYMIATGGLFQSGNAFIGEVSAFGGNFAPNGWLPADGRLVNIQDFDTLFNLIGTTYGGDGQTNFALPDLRGRAIVGSGNGVTIGSVFGSEGHILTVGEMPAHDHDGGTIQVDPAGGSQPFDNEQPSLALNYYIALQGIFPARDGGFVDTTEPFLGEIVASAADIAPQGYALAAGQLLPINQNQALFSILGTTFGGDGKVTFALPDLRGRTIVDWGNGITYGEQGGHSFETLTVSQLPIHTHSLPDTRVPEPATWAMMIAGFAMAGMGFRRRRPARA
jgi:microcystin-dependent protein